MFKLRLRQLLPDHSGCQLDQGCRLAITGADVGREVEGVEEVFGSIGGVLEADADRIVARFFDTPGECEAMGGYCQDVDMRVRAGRGLDGPFRRFLEGVEPDERDRSGAEPAEEQRIAGAQQPRMVGCGDRRRRIAGLRVDEGERIVAEGEVGAQKDGALQLAHRLIVVPGYTTLAALVFCDFSRAERATTA